MRFSGTEDHPLSIQCGRQGGKGREGLPRMYLWLTFDPNFMRSASKSFHVNPNLKRDQFVLSGGSGVIDLGVQLLFRDFGGWGLIQYKLVKKCKKLHQSKFYKHDFKLPLDTN